MYCKNCGKELENGSLFCIHCGKEQNSKHNSFNLKYLWIVYIIWAIVHLFMMTGTKYVDSVSVFYPSIFSDHSWDDSYYDFSEYFVYVFVIPAILFYIIRRFISKN